MKTPMSETLKSRTRLPLILATLVGAMSLPHAHATDRLFTYTYEPEGMPKGTAEFEQWVTLRSQRTKNVGKENYNRWELREEFEYGVTDNYTIDFYLNTKAESFRDPATDMDSSSFEFAGISLANRFNLVNPATHPLGFTLYLEPTFAGEEAAFEQKLIFGQRYGNWKWALNLIHETEWEENFHETIGEVEATFGLSYELSKSWWLGAEVRNVNEIPEYKEWESSAAYVGPAVHYRSENWWATLTVLPQVWGKDYDGGTDRISGFDLAHNERINIRLIFGIHF
jgi:hypothetical protein